MNTATQAEKLVAYAFTVHELRILFQNAEFRSLTSEMLSVEDAAKVIDLGNAILKQQRLSASGSSAKREGEEQRALDYIRAELDK